MTLYGQPEGPNFDYLSRNASRMVRLVLIPFAVLVLVIIFVTFVTRVTRIEAGQVGVEINLAGSQGGASEIPIRTGWVVYSPLRTQIIEFPTYVQTVKWTRSWTKGIR